MTRRRQASLMDNIAHETARADRNAASLTAAARASLDLIEAAIMADERGRTYGDPDTDRDALYWRNGAMQALGSLRALLSPESHRGT